MKKIISLIYKTSSNRVVVDFGIPENEDELKKMYSLRYKSYSKKGYLNLDKCIDNLDIDENDSLNFRHLYIVASCEDEYIGTLRSIKKTPLPTEEDFEFKKPEIFKDIASDKLREIGRLISISNPKTNILPRGLIMLFMLHTASIIFKSENIYGGYAFIKETLLKKMVKRNMPFHIIKEYKETYPKDGVLYPYFHQKNDPVVPMYFLTEEFLKYTNKKTHSPLIFKWNTDREVLLKNNLLTRILVNS